MGIARETRLSNTAKQSRDGCDEISWLEAWYYEKSWILKRFSEKWQMAIEKGYVENVPESEIETGWWVWCIPQYGVITDKKRWAPCSISMWGQVELPDRL